MRILSIAIALVLLTSHGTATADDWMAATASWIASPNGLVVVRVVPGTSLGDVQGFAGAQKGEPATALYYGSEGQDRFVLYQQVTLLNPIAPVYYAVTDSGVLVTLDNWHNVGIGKVLVVYAPTGEVLKSYSLSEMYSGAEIEKMPRSVSSVLWRCGQPVLDIHGRVLTINDVLGNVIGMDLETGRLERTVTNQSGCQDAI